MYPDRRSPQDLDERAANSCQQRIAGGEGYGPRSGNLAKEPGQPLSQRARPWQPLLVRKLRDQTELSRTSEQDFCLLDQGPETLGEVTPPSCAQSDYLDHASDCMPGPSIPPTLRFTPHQLVGHCTIFQMMRSPTN